MAGGLPLFGGIVYVYTMERISFWIPNTFNGHLFMLEVFGVLVRMITAPTLLM